MHVKSEFREVTQAGRASEFFKNTLSRMDGNGSIRLEEVKMCVVFPIIAKSPSGISMSDLCEKCNLEEGFDNMGTYNITKAIGRLGDMNLILNKGGLIVATNHGNALFSFFEDREMVKDWLASQTKSAIQNGTDPIQVVRNILKVNDLVHNMVTDPQPKKRFLSRALRID
ncbi:MAG: hypothetical protein KGH64_05790 [Candidatus Micrarchaeota archaeon]|nr:hypothetical protein [Candidatus Micrarchaeota archaeon]MDE1834818.1 hypothetical protein [Candidatus Micrarchaeota archaeon]MDE1859118.1 hypothetical protein [Candidatus Micrarchaeota archaeon]